MSWSSIPAWTAISPSICLRLSDESLPFLQPFGLEISLKTGTGGVSLVLASLASAPKNKGPDIDPRLSFNHPRASFCSCPNLWTTHTITLGFLWEMYEMIFAKSVPQITSNRPSPRIEVPCLVVSKYNSVVSQARNIGLQARQLVSERRSGRAGHCPRRRRNEAFETRKRKD